MYKMQKCPHFMKMIDDMVCIRDKKRGENVFPYLLFCRYGCFFEVRDEMCIAFKLVRSEQCICYPPVPCGGNLFPQAALQII